MEEKARKKEAERRHFELEEMREEQRLRGEYPRASDGVNQNQTSDFGAFKSGMPAAAPVVNKTLYNNHHQFSIIGTHTG